MPFGREVDAVGAAMSWADARERVGGERLAAVLNALSAAGVSSARQQHERLLHVTGASALRASTRL